MGLVRRCWRRLPVWPLFRSMLIPCWFGLPAKRWHFPPTDRVLVCIVPLPRPDPSSPPAAFPFPLPRTHQSLPPFLPPPPPPPRRRGAHPRSRRSASGWTGRSWPPRPRRRRRRTTGGCVAPSGSRKRRSGWRWRWWMMWCGRSGRPCAPRGDGEELGERAIGHGPNVDVARTVGIRKPHRGRKLEKA